MDIAHQTVARKRKAFIMYVVVREVGYKEPPRDFQKKEICLVGRAK